MWIDILYLYFFFCLVTSIAMVLKTLGIFFKSKPGIPLLGTITYLLTVGLITFALAPIFFFIYLFYSKGYEESTIKHLTQGDNEDGMG